MMAVVELRRLAQIVHHVPGRLRLRVALEVAARLSREQRQQLLAGVQTMEGIVETRLNPAAASLVIHYDPQRIPAPTWEVLFGSDPQAALVAWERLQPGG